MRSRAETLARALGVLTLSAALIVSAWRAWSGGSAQRGHSMPPLRLDASLAAGDTVVARAVRDRIIIEAARQARAAPEHDAQLLPAVQVVVVQLPNAAVRRVLGATRAAGISLRWHDSTSLRAFAVSAVRSTSPDSSVDVVGLAEFAPSTSARVVAASAPRVDDAIVLADDGGVLDSINVPTVSAARASAASAPPLLRLRVASLAAPASARVWHEGRVVAVTQATPHTFAAVGRIRVYAQPGWESKFVTAALEESGWRVDATYLISPKAALVRVGRPALLDTATYAAAVVLDSAAVSARDVMRFVSQGGGVVIAGNALRDGSLRALTAATVEDDRGPIAGALMTDAPRRGVPAFHLQQRGHATVLEREGEEPTIVLARRDVGRVMAVGYRESWHWRMEGRDDAADAFRTWWNGLVASVAYRGSGATAADARTTLAWPGDAAPVADMIAQLGASQEVDASALSADGQQRGPRVATLVLWLFAVLIVGSLLVEWAMRRLRGAA